MKMEIFNLFLLVGILIGFPLFISNANAVTPSLHLPCEGDMRDVVSDHSPIVKGITYADSIPGLGRAADFTYGSSVKFVNSGFWTADRGTFTAWIKPLFDFMEDDERHDFFAIGNDPNFHLSWIGGKQGNSANPAGHLNFKTKPPGFNDDCNLYTKIDDIFRDNDWHHVACTWGEDGKKIYVDGVLKAVNYNYFRYNGSSTPIYIGCSSHYGQMEICPVNCWMDEIRFYKVNLSENDIKDIYNEVTFSPDSVGTISGRVIDASTGLGLAGVQVVVNPGNHIIITQSGTFFNRISAGNYTLNISPGLYEIKYTRDGYRSWCYGNVRVNKGEVTFVDASMCPGEGETPCVPFDDEVLCSPGDPLYFYVVQKAKTSGMMTVLSIVNLCPVSVVDDLSVEYYMNEGENYVLNRPAISINPMGHVLKFSDELHQFFEEDSEGWMIVKSEKAKLSGDESICASPVVDHAVAFPSFTPKKRWTIFYLTSISGWTTMMSIFNPGKEGAEISIKAYGDNGSLIAEESVIKYLPSKYQIVRQVQDYFSGLNIKDGWIEVYSPNSPLLVYRYMVAK